MAKSLPKGTHTVIVALGDLNGIARGKRMHAGVWEEFKHGIGMCNAIFQMDVTNDIWDTPYANFANGYADFHIVPMVETMRPVPWEEGVVLVVGRAEEMAGARWSATHATYWPSQLAKAAEEGYEVMTGVEFEFYLLDLETKELVDSGISVYGLARGAMFEHVVGPIRNLCSEMGIQVEMSNPEYAPGQIEINLRYREAMVSADNAMLFRNAVKEIAYNHGYLATFMAKPFFMESGNSFHMHQSLWKDGKNAFSDEGRLSALGRSYLGGLQQHMAETALISAPTPNAMKRRQDYTFCPTSNAWGGDNRTVGLRVIEGSESSTRIEQRDGSSDANPYLLTAVQLAAGLKGIAGEAEPTAKEVSDGYAATRHQGLPRDIPTALELFNNSEFIAEVLPEPLRVTLAQQAEREHNFMVESDPEGWQNRRHPSGAGPLPGSLLRNASLPCHGQGDRDHQGSRPARGDLVAGDIGGDEEGEETVVADAVGAGAGELILVAEGSAARQAVTLRGLPTDAAAVMTLTMCREPSNYRPKPGPRVAPPLAEH